MSKKTRIRISADGAIRLPEELLEKLEWASGHYLEFAIEENGVRLEKVDVDPFAEAMKKPDPSEFDRLLGTLSLVIPLGPEPGMTVCRARRFSY